MAGSRSLGTTQWWRARSGCQGLSHQSHLATRCHQSQPWAPTQAREGSLLLITIPLEPTPPGPRPERSIAVPTVTVMALLKSANSPPVSLFRAQQCEHMEKISSHWASGKMCSMGDMCESGSWHGQALSTNQPNIEAQPVLGVDWGCLFLTDCLCVSGTGWDTKTKKCWLDQLRKAQPCHPLVFCSSSMVRCWQVFTVTLIQHSCYGLSTMSFVYPLLDLMLWGYVRFCHYLNPLPRCDRTCWPDCRLTWELELVEEGFDCFSLRIHSEWFNEEVQELFLQVGEVMCHISEFVSSVLL